MVLYVIWYRINHRHGKYKWPLTWEWIGPCRHRPLGEWNSPPGVWWRPSFWTFSRTWLHPSKTLAVWPSLYVDLFDLKLHLLVFLALRIELEPSYLDVVVGCVVREGAGAQWIVHRLKVVYRNLNLAPLLLTATPTLSIARLSTPRHCSPLSKEYVSSESPYRHPRSFSLECLSRWTSGYSLRSFHTMHGHPGRAAQSFVMHLKCV